MMKTTMNVCLATVAIVNIVPLVVLNGIFVVLGRMQR